MANYFTSAKKTALKQKLKGAFPSRLVDVLIDEIEDALTDFDTDEVVDQITAQIVDGELIDAAIDALIAAGIADGGDIDNATDTLVSAGASFSSTPDAAANDAVMANVALTAEAQAGVTAGLTDPDVPRPLLVVTTLGGGTLTGTVTIDGTDVDDNVISEDVTLNDAADVQTDKCFKTVTSVDLPAQTTAGDGIAIGTVAKIGSPVLLTKDTIYMALVDGAQDTLPTVTVHATDKAQVIIEPNTAPDGSKVFDFYYHA